MLYVFLSTLGMSMLILSLKIANYKHVNGNHVGFWNYVVAFVADLIVSIIGGSFVIFKELGKADLISAFSEPSLAGTALIILVFGFISGNSFPSSVVSMKVSIAANGSAITSFFKQMSILGGLLVAIVFMGERPSVLQWIGIGLMIIAIVLMVCDFKNLRITNVGIIVVVFITATVMEITNKIISKYTVPGYATLYLTITFGIAIIFMAIVILKTEGRDARITGWEEIFYGAIMGFSNIGSNYFKIKALTVLPSAIVMPCVAAGALIITNLVSILIFKEKANKLYGVAVIIAIISIFLLNR